MKIKLLFDVPVSKEEGMTKDRILDVLKVEKGGLGKGFRRAYWVMGDVGRVKIWDHECEKISD